MLFNSNHCASYTSYLNNCSFIHRFNGVIVKLPSVPLGGALAIDGNLVLGIDTQSNNSSSGATAYAVNQVQFWHDFRAEVVDRELAAAKKYFGISTLRVFLHTINFFEDKANFMANLEKFLRICEKHGIRPGLVFFDGCHRHEGIYLDKPTEPVAGYHNGRWAQSPQAREIEPENLEKFKPYIQEIIRAYRTDKRVLFWEIHNEPPPGDAVRDKLKRAGYAWAKEVKPVQPVFRTV